MSRTSTLAVLAVAALVASPARADPAPLRIQYAAAPGCPGEEIFLDEIRWRTSLARAAAPDEAALFVSARIVRRGGAIRGRIVVGSGTDAITREVEGARCDEVVSALALITALAVDPHARTSPRAAPAPPDLPPLLPLSPALPLPAPPPPSQVTALPPPEIIGEPLPALPVLPDSPPPPSGSRWSFGARFSMALSVTPRPLLGGGFLAERALDERWHASIRLAAELTGTGGFDVGPGGVWFVRGIARVEGCAFGLQAGARVLLVPCLGVEGGAIGGGGILRGSLAEVSQAAVPWVAADLVPRVAIDLGRFLIEAQGGPVFPAVRRTFSFKDPHYVIWELPPVTWSVGLAAGVHFP